MWRRIGCSVFVAALAACGGDGVTDPGTTGGDDPGTSVTALSVSPAAKTMVVGETLQLAVQALDKLGLPLACTHTYVSSAANVAAVSSGGVVTAKAVGSAVIKVSCLAGISAEVKINVVAKVRLAATLVVTPGEKTLNIGESIKLNIAAKALDGLACDCTPTYVSANAAIASVTSTGLVKAKAAGEVWITVTCVGGVSAKVKIIVKASLELPVSIGISPVKNLLVGETFKLKLTVKDKYGNPCDCQPTFVSANVNIAKVSVGGLITAKAAGEVWITVTCVGGLSAKVKVIVVAAPHVPVPHTVTIDPLLGSLKIGATIKLNIVAKDINGLLCDCTPVYSSDNLAIATVSASGLVTAKAAGEVWINVLCAGGVSAKVKVIVRAAVASVTLGPVSLKLKIGSTLQLTAIAKDINGLPVDCLCTFSSLAPLLATVTETGLVSGLLPGLAEVSATCEGITVKSSLLLSLL